MTVCLLTLDIYGPEGHKSDIPPTQTIWESSWGAVSTYTPKTNVRFHIKNNNTEIPTQAHRPTSNYWSYFEAYYKNKQFKDSWLHRCMSSKLIGNKLTVMHLKSVFHYLWLCQMLYLFVQETFQGTFGWRTCWKTMEQFPLANFSKVINKQLCYFVIKAI